MLSSKHGKHVQWRDLNYWDFLAIVAGTLTVIAALGEWVFHWWNEPGELVSAGGLILTLLLAGFAASKRDVRGVRQEIREFRSEARDGQAKLLAGQERQTTMLERMTGLLEQMVASFRTRP